MRVTQFLAVGHIAEKGDGGRGVGNAGKRMKCVMGRVSTTGGCHYACNGGTKLTSHRKRLGEKENVANLDLLKPISTRFTKF